MFSTGYENEESSLKLVEKGALNFYNTVLFAVVCTHVEKQNNSNVACICKE